jgi:monofunctional biosynthetic peptidoglycan transglycosylase
MMLRPRRWLVRLHLAAEIATVAIALALLALWCSIPDTEKLATENPTTTAFIELRREQAAAAGKPLALKWEWRPLGKISRYLRAAVVYAEDGHFYEHEGVDWEAVESAFDRNLAAGEFAVGGSTITQQLAKNLYLSPSRSLIRKLREMLIAFSLEDHLSKQRILELYLNIAEWGDGVFGAEAAARHWFGHSAQSLSPAEAARLAIALPNPFTRSPNIHTIELRKKAVRIIRLFRMQGLINAAQEREALDAVGAQSARVRPDRSLPPGQPATSAQSAGPAPPAAPALPVAPAPAQPVAPAPAQPAAPAPPATLAPPATPAQPAASAPPQPATPRLETAPAPP